MSIPCANTKTAKSPGFLRRPSKTNRLAALLLATAMAGVFLPTSAAAAPTAPTISGTTANFTGDQHLGIVVANSGSPVTPDASSASVYNIQVYSLTKDITPSSPYPAGIYLNYAAANGSGGNPGGAGNNGGTLWLSNSGGSYLLKPADTALTGIIISSAGGSGGSGDNVSKGTSATGGNGGGGGLGGAVSLLSSSGAIQANIGINIQNHGGNGGNGGSGKASINGTGGDGGKGGDTGTITANTSSGITSSAQALAVSSVAGNGGSGGYGGASNAHGGNGGTGGHVADLSIVNTGTLHAQNGDAFTVTTQGGDGGNGGDGGGIGAYGGDGGAGGAGGTITYIYSSGSITAVDGGALKVGSIGGRGGDGGAADGVGGTGGAAGYGGAGAPIEIKNQGPITVQMLAQSSARNGVEAVSTGGAGGTGGRCTSGTSSKAGAGGYGGAGGSVGVNNSSSISATGVGILAKSLGGIGGQGGTGGGTAGAGGAGSDGGAGGSITVSNGTKSITTTGGDGILAWSIGALGGSGGDGNGISGIGRDGGNGGNSGIVSVTNKGAITIQGGSSVHGIYARSQAGEGADGGTGSGVGGKGGAGGIGGTGGAVTVDNQGAISTYGVNSQGILAESLGGRGGDGGEGDGMVGIGGASRGSGPGGNVTVTSSGTLKTTGRGIFAHSVGGFSGAAGDAAGLFAFGADSNSAGAGGNVSVGNSGSITTTEADSDAIFAQSVGGGGGSGGSSGGLVSLGGVGGSGGAGGTVSVTNSGSLQAGGDHAGGLFAQSIGGGGGDGGAAIAAALELDVAIGGSGGAGGNGGAVSVTSSKQIRTSGDNAAGIQAQSAGGGGGAGGYTVSAAAGIMFTASLDLGGSGGSGGQGGAVSVSSSSDITTSGENGYGILAESLGGGGGVGGASITANAALGSNFGLTLGGSGGSGGSAQKVMLTTGGGSVTTSGINAGGILAQSIGGGGGAGGLSANGSLGVVSIDVGLGATGGSGGSGGELAIDNNSIIQTSGAMANGLLAQSVGGGGGAGGYNIGAADGALSGSFSFGGSGGVGGTGGVVGVTNRAAITTAGANADGILAQSIGGGGGAGGYSLSADLGIGTLGLSLGGNGAAGSSGSAVTLVNSGKVTTYAKDSSGILAQSLGGGGGAGGWAGSGAISFGVKAGEITIPSLGLAIGLGGSGGTGSNGGTVSVHNTGAVATGAEGSAGLTAQSIGGGGGDGGWGAAGEMNLAVGKTYSASVAVAHGGKGGSGGTGGDVSLNNEGSVQTAGDNATAVFAQSIGGGGGNGGASVAVTLEASSSSASTFNTSVSVGGSSGGGGAAGRVDLSSTAPVSTLGDKSMGVSAQSIGGGGGNGGASISGTLGLSTTAHQLAVSVGGSGGTGGNGGEVTLAATGSVSTAGEAAVGVFTQSVGGGGGNGGLSFDGNLSFNQTKNINVSVGGSGGAGGSGNAVQVTTAGTISTAGSDAHGIQAQSVGGGGGNGSFGGTGIASFQGKYEESSALSLSVNVGGSGGVAGSGGNVTVDNQSAITTTGGSAYGIYAQSVGGGGGSAGGGFTGHFSTEFENAGKSWELGVTIGGSGGDGNNGGTVAVTNKGNISTLSDNAYGIFAQSVGGGGGAGGDARALAIALSMPELKSEGFSSMDVSVGGSGGGASHGGNVTVTNTGMIVTRGDDADGIFAQSVGGGGGTGGAINGDYLRTTIFPGILGVTVGGNGGGSSNGGTVTISNSGAITTLGASSSAIKAQSVGAGGGEGGEGEVGFVLPYIGIGGAAGAGGNGGDVTVTNSGALDTSGDGSCGIFAQSVGGGGGVAGNVGRFSVYEDEEEGTNVDIGIGIAWARDGGAGGDGGRVTVTNNSDITTRGANAYGILAQSVGGGGGVAGEVGYGPGTGLNYLFGSVGAAGSGGYVSISQTGNITTFGEGATGILAQSAGGEGDGHGVSITLTGSIVANGDHADGIYAQTIGGQNSGSINITINSGTVQGGAQGHGIVFRDGIANSLHNYGTITTADGVNGVAILSDNSRDADYLGNFVTSYNNYGTMTGTIVQSGTVAPTYFYNQSGALYNSGATIDLGNKSFSNSGTVNLGGGSAIRSELTGNFTQAAGGVLQTTLNDDGSCGSLKVSGKATLGGTLRALPGSGAFVNGTTYSILTAGQNLTTTFATVDLPSTPLLSFNTTYLPREVQVQSAVNSFTAAAANPHHSALALHLDTLLTSAGDDLMPFLGLFQTVDESNYRNAFQSFSPGIYDAGTTTTLAGGRQYLRALQQRLHLLRVHPAAPEQTQAARTRPLVVAANSLTGLVFPDGRVNSPYRRLGMSLQGFGQRGSQKQADGISGYDYTLAGGSLGLDYAVSERLIAGVDFGFARTDIDQDNDFADGTIDSYYGSLYATYSHERAYLAGIFTYGSHSYDTQRLINIGTLWEQAESDHDGASLSAFVEGGYTLPLQGWAVQPLASLLYAVLDEESYREQGAGALDMLVSGRRTEQVLGEVGLRVSGEIPVAAGKLIPEVKAAWQHDFAVDDSSLSFAYAGAPTGLKIDGRERGRDSAVIDCALTLINRAGLSTAMKYNIELGDSYTAQSLTGELKLAF